MLYPGRAGDGDDAHKSFRRYHEIVPGIGAFAIRPTRDDAAPPGLAKLVGFIGDVLRHHLTTFTQSYRVGYWTHETIRETAEAYGDPVAPAAMPPGLVDRPPKDVPVLLGYVRSEQEAELCREKRVFFCHGVEWDDPKSPDRKPGKTSDLDFDPFRSELFVAYNSGRSAAWIAPVGEVKLVTARERATEQGREVGEMRAAYYYRFQLGEAVGYPRLDVSECVKRRPGKPVQKALSELAACPVVDDADAE